MIHKLSNYRQEQALKEKAETFIAQIDHDLGTWAIEKKLTLLPTEKLLLNAAYLVDGCHQGHFRQAAIQLKTKLPELSYQVSGPWPPYNFVVRTSRPPQRRQQP